MEELSYNENNIFVGLDNHQEGHNEHHQKWNQYIAEKAALLGTTVTRVKVITQKVHGDVSDADLPPSIND